MLTMLFGGKMGKAAKMIYMIRYDMTTLFSVGKNNYNLGFHN